MATPSGQDLTLYFRGTQLTGTSGNVTRVLKRLPVFSPFEIDVASSAYVGPMDLYAEQGDPAVKPMTMTLYMTHKIAGVASALAAERECMDEIRAWHATLLPMNGTGTIKVHRHNASTSDVETEVLFARVLTVQRYGGDVVAGGEMVEATRAFLETETKFYCPLPYFYASAATTAELEAADPHAHQTCANAGSLPVGVRFEVKAAGVTGHPQSITVTNNTNSYSFVWTKGSDFAPGEYIDWFYTDPREMAMTTGTSITGATGDDYMELASGNNDVQALTDTGTVTLTISWKRRDLSL